jgi:nucleoside-diphosphate-sugar epimerase
MRRREFLQRTSSVMAGSAALWTASAADVDAAAEPGTDRAGVLVTGAETVLARQIAATLSDKYAVRLTSVEPVVTDLPFSPCSLEAEDEVAELLRGVSSIVHLGSAAAAELERSMVGLGPRRTYHLLQGAVAAGVRRVVHLGSLDLVDGFDSRYLVDEDFGPQTIPGTGLLPMYLDEFCCREFARSGRLQVVVLRLAPVTDANQPASASDGSPRLELQDAVQAVRRALETERISDGRGIDSWSVFHILSNPQACRFPISRAQRILGYAPQV